MMEGDVDKFLPVTLLNLHGDISLLSQINSDYSKYEKLARYTTAKFS